ncbi:hypothetical protein RBH76_10570 [Oscillospiraceae bacterium MB24-C1]|nr:hypothetical protein RBH76_10570 [Oscillospiraceae bacterium MB24-C1]
MNILLVEPNYKNKYPPMGLMKISTFHKNRQDSVVFYKGNMAENEFRNLSIDRVYITTLFTFYYHKTVETIKHYSKHIDPSCIYIGGIMASLLTEQLQQDIGNCHILIGQLTDAEVLGLQDHTNIDMLPLDYSILDEIEYDYPAGDNYLSYTTRGCPNHCAFCAVPLLEPNYQFTNNIRDQIENVNSQFGQKRNLLLLDNNIFNLSVDQMQKLVNDLKAVGFTKEPTFIKQTPFEQYLTKRHNERMHPKILSRAIDFLKGQHQKLKNSKHGDAYKEFLDQLDTTNDKDNFLVANTEFINDILRMHKRPLKRFIDFNQGLEAARITPEKMELLAQLPLNPVRIAFDHYNPAAVENYRRAIVTAYECGINHFSNYMLYNFDDRPDSLWYRLKLNIDLAKELHISIFSFPMKYMPISKTDRSHIGPHWNKKYLQAISAILLVTKGVVAQGENFFNRAFGTDIDEFYRILFLPRDFIIYRSFYETQGITQQWDAIYRELSKEGKDELLNALVDTNYQSAHRLVQKLIPFYNKEYTYAQLTRKG